MFGFYNSGWRDYRSQNHNYEREECASDNTTDEIHDNVESVRLQQFEFDSNENNGGNIGLVMPNKRATKIDSVASSAGTCVFIKSSKNNKLIWPENDTTNKIDDRITAGGQSAGDHESHTLEWQDNDIYKIKSKKTTKYWRDEDDHVHARGGNEYWEKMEIKPLLNHARDNMYSIKSVASGKYCSAGINGTNEDFFICDRESVLGAWEEFEITTSSRC